MLPAPPGARTWATSGRAYGGGHDKWIHTPFTIGKRTGNPALRCLSAEWRGRFCGRSVSTTRAAKEHDELPGRVHLDRRDRASPLLRSKTKIVPDGEEPGIWGFDGSSTNQATAATRTAVLSRSSCARPPAGPRATSWSCARSSSPTSPRTRPTPGQVPGGGREVTPTRALVRHPSRSTRSSRTGGPSAGRSTATRPPGPYYCGAAGARARRAIVERHHQGLHGRRARHRGHQRRGDDGQWEFQIGILASRESRPALGGPLAASSASPRTSGLRHARAQARRR